MVAISLYLFAASVALVAVYLKYLYRWRRRDEPPMVPGGLIWGNCKEFGEHAVRFLHKSHKSCGDIFTIRLLHQYLTIVMDPHSYDRFTREKTFDFDPIQKQVNHNVFSFELINPRKMLKEAGKTVRGHYMNNIMQNFSKYLNETFADISTKDILGNLHDIPKGENWCASNLRVLTARTMFTSLFKTIFGNPRPEDTFQPMPVFENFEIYHKYFNYMWLGLPSSLFPAATKALKALVKQPCSSDFLSREDLSHYIRFSTEYMLNYNQAETEIMGHNLVYLHVNYNTFRVSFWTMYFLLEHREAWTALSTEIQTAVDEKKQYCSSDEPIAFNLDEVESLPILDSIVKETMRSTSGVFMVRAISEDTKFEMENGQKYFLRKGDKVAMYPPALHKDPEIFEEPEQFKYDRFVDAKFYKNGREVKNPVIAFGSLCPGKRLAIAQSKWFLMCLVNMFDLELLEGQRTCPDSAYHGHEILPPKNDVEVRFRHRNSFQTLSFE
ncbi:hypothetical protein ACJMK2_015942 [Sinanodonta woodiana]|uniref:Cytochrome P450 n=1 Tax=Sinanodonta woodiana TaxID=1069815 RepID=A0ABD3UUU7_SINWO